MVVTVKQFCQNTFKIPTETSFVLVFNRNTTGS